MKTALALAYFFPPGGGAGVQRTVKFARYLPEFGYRFVAIARPAHVRSRWSPDDLTLETELGRGTDVVRVATEPPVAASRKRRRLERWARTEPAVERWWRTEAVAAGLAAGGDANVVYATMSPWESGDAAAELARRLGKPWVADLRDPWVLDEMQFYPSGLHRALEGRRMQNMLASAGAIVMNTDEARVQLLARFPALRSKRVSVITNGYDSADFAGPPPTVDGSAFRIVHTGHLHTELGGAGGIEARVRRLVGGRVRGVDFLTRSHIFLMQAVERVLRERPAAASRLEVHLAGGLSDADRDAITLECVRTYGYVSHPQSVEFLRSADLLFLPMQNLPRGTRATIVPGKTYEYLASGRPILAAVPEGDARDLLAQHQRATVVWPDDVDGMVRAILAGLDAGRTPDVPPTDLGAYERRDQARRLAEIFDAVSA